MSNGELIKNFTEFYLDYDALTEEEAGKELMKAGVDVKGIKKKGAEFLRKKKAELAIEKGRKRKEEFEKLVYGLSPVNNDDGIEGLTGLARFGYRKKNGNGSDDDIEEDAKLLKRMKGKKR